VSDGDGLQLDAQSSGDVFEAGIEVLQWTEDEPRPDGDGGSVDGDGGGPADEAGDGGQQDGGGGDSGSGDGAGTVVSGGCSACSAAAPGGCWSLLLLAGLLLLGRRGR